MENQRNRYWKPQGDRDEEEIVVHSSHDAHLSADQRKVGLPIWKYRKNILYAVENYPVVVLVGETGSGKSTQVPQILYEFGWTNASKAIVCTQPRRVAAVTLANRVAEELRVDIGGIVGYNVRFDSKYTATTEIKYVTDGVLVRETLSDPMLSKYSVVMVDDAHERSLNSDILLGLLKKIQKKRKGFRTIVTSATLEANALYSFFNLNSTGDHSKDTCCVLSMQGRVFPIDILYTMKPVFNYLQSCVETVINIHLHELMGDVLVFVTSGEECDACVTMLHEQYAGSNIVGLPLYSSLPYSLQMRVFDNSYGFNNVRKVIFATNIAESSVTIPGIRYVVDCGFVKLKYFDVNSGVESLLTCVASRASADQRAGRAGRTEPGKCFRLMPESVFSSSSEIPDHSQPEMQRLDISWALLQLKMIGIDDVLHFDFLSPPSSQSLVYALEILYSLGAIDGETGSVTEIGREMAELPLDPKMAKCLISSYREFGCVSELLTIAALASVDTPFALTKGNISKKQKVQESLKDYLSVEGDQITLLKIYRDFEIVYEKFQKKGNVVKSPLDWCSERGLQSRILQRAYEIRAQLESILKLLIRTAAMRAKYGEGYTVFETPNEIWRDAEKTVMSSCDDDMVPVLKCLVSGMFSSVAKLQNDGFYYSVRGSVPLTQHPQSVLSFHGKQPAEWVLYRDLIFVNSDNPYSHQHVDGRMIAEGIKPKIPAQMRDIARIDPKWLIELASHYYSFKT